MSRSLALLIGGGIGAAATYFFDTERGVRRRASLSHQAMRLQHRVRDTFDAATTSSRENRKRSNGTPNDAALTERVRKAVARSARYPAAIEVSANGGVLTLSGPILASDVPLVIDCVLDVVGVRDVVNRLEIHRESGNVPALQGTPEGARWRSFQGYWPTNTRIAAGLLGLGLVSYGASTHGLINKGIGVAGLILLARATSNRELRRLARLNTRPHAIAIRKAMRLNAPVERVFEIWANPESFPNFMTHVREVQRLAGSNGSDRWHWKIRGSSGMEFDFNSIIAAYEQNRYIAWRTEPDAWIRHAGSARFFANPDGTTTVDVKLSYQPVAGAVGHAIAKMLGDDPKKQLEDDLARMKQYVETGVATSDAAVKNAGVTTAPRPAM